MGVSNYQISQTDEYYSAAQTEEYNAVAQTSEYYQVTNVTDRTAPVIQSAVVPADGLTIEMTYDDTLDPNSVPTVGDFGIGLISGCVVNAVAISGKVVMLTLSRTVNTGEVLNVSYFPGSNPIQDEYGNQAVYLSGQAVTNNSTQ